jgi:hypothetical protein
MGIISDSSWFELVEAHAMPSYTELPIQGKQQILAALLRKLSNLHKNTYDRIRSFSYDSIECIENLYKMQ